MKARTLVGLAFVAALIGMCACTRMRDGAASENVGDARGTTWREEFDVNKANLVSRGTNTYLPVQAGRVLKLAHSNERLTLSILPETREVDGVKVAVLEEREEKNGQIVEISCNYLAADPKTGDVFYFGEDVDNYRNGKVVNHESAWLSGEKGARFGLFMPGAPRLGDRFYQEIAPGVALDSIEVVSTNETVRTPAGTFHHCVHLRETTPLEPDISHKFFYPRDRDDQRRCVRTD